MVTPYSLSSGHIIHDKVGVNLDCNPNDFKVNLSSIDNNSRINPYQKWTSQDMGDGTYRIIHTLSNLALDADANAENKPQVYLSRPENNNESNGFQRWRFVLISDTYMIIHNISGFVLEARADRKVYLSAPEISENHYQRWWFR
ncbi:hypothetical protein Glove_51g68 [Diversispora epigaea]|uniref:Ricin B lectin domain-containing protein n=1 Tax=Diversispora epigaea TaxID=1348612 RepID=A0A397JGU7_9GLOM|nr:hypothetical protein Glove_51g68 [Diversispora epigaea]